MAGTIAGGIKARDKNLAKDPDYYKKIGHIGGSNSTTGGFASEKVGPDGLTGRQRAIVAGAKGGRNGRRKFGHIGDKVIEVMEKTGKTVEEITPEDLL